MSDDIVRRLREDFITDGHCDYCEQWEWRGHYSECPYQSAANEIERLRQLADNLAHHLQGYVCHCNMSKCKCGYDDVMDEYQAVRGE